MAPKREKSLLENPPAASTSEDEDVEDEEEEEEVEEQVHEVDEEEEEEEEEEEDDEEEEEEEEENEATTGKPNSSSAVKKPKSDSTPSSGSKPQTPSSDEEEEDESEESDSEPTPPKLKPLEPSRSSNPNGGKPVASQPKKTVAKPSTTPSATTTTPAKRPLESENDSKRKKKKVDDEDSNPEESEVVRSTFGPKSIFQRLWSDEDEIIVLKGMIQFKNKGVDPFSNMTEFLDSIKRHLHVVVKTDQLNNKIKRLKKKYLNNYKRGKGDEDPVFSKPHDVICYDLMKEIWGGKEGNIRENNGKDGSVVANGKKSKSKKSNKTLSLSDISMRESSKMDERNGSMHPCVQGMVHSGNNNMAVGESFLKEGLGLIGESKSKDLEKKWKSLYAAELQVYLRRVELVREQTMAILEAHKSSDT